MVFVMNNEIDHHETSRKLGIAAPGNVKEARCQTPQAKPTSIVLFNIEYFSNNFGSRKPRHPNSSPIGPNGRANKNQTGILEIPAIK